MKSKTKRPPRQCWVLWHPESQNEFLRQMTFSRLKDAKAYNESHEGTIVGPYVLAERVRQK